LGCVGVVIVIVVLCVEGVGVLCRLSSLNWSWLGLDISILMGWVIWVDERVSSGTVSTWGNTVYLLGVAVSWGIVGSVSVITEVAVGWVIRVDERVPVWVGSLGRLDIVVGLYIVIVLVGGSSLLDRSWSRLPVIRVMCSRVLSIGSCGDMSSFEDFEPVHPS